MTTQLEEILSTLQTLANNVVRLDQNMTVMASTIEAESEEASAFRREVRTTLTRLETAVTELSRDVVQIRERVVEVDTQADRRLKLLENGHGRENGHGHG